MVCIRTLILHRIEKALEKDHNDRVNNLKVDITKEREELPNADIIYTFDDDIINEYYRYE